MDIGRTDSAPARPRPGRFVLVGSLANLLLAALHLMPARAGVFASLQAGLALSRVVHGVLEFVAFVTSRFVEAPQGVVIFLVLAGLGPLVLNQLLAAWKQGGETRFFVVLMVAANVLFGASAAYAGALPVREVASCTTSYREGSLRLTKFEEVGWLPEAHAFLEWSADGKEPFRHLAQRTLPDTILDPCRDVRSVFPDLDALLPTTSVLE